LIKVGRYVYDKLFLNMRKCIFYMVTYSCYMQDLYFTMMGMTHKYV